MPGFEQLELIEGPLQRLSGAVGSIVDALLGRVGALIVPPSAAMSLDLAILIYLARVVPAYLVIGIVEDCEMRGGPVDIKILDFVVKRLNISPQEIANNLLWLAAGWLGKERQGNGHLASIR